MLRASTRDIAGIAAPAALATGAITAAQPANGKQCLSDLAAGAAIGWIAEALVSALFDRVTPAPIAETAIAVAAPDDT